MSSKKPLPGQSEKTAPLAQPETSGSSDDGNSTGSAETKTDSTVVSPTHEPSSPEGTEQSPGTSSGPSGSNLPKDESPSGSATDTQSTSNPPSGSAAGTQSTSDPPSVQATGTSEAPASGGGSDLSPQDPSANEGSRAAEIQGLIDRGNTGNPDVKPRLRWDVIRRNAYYTPQPQVDPNEYTGVVGCFVNCLQFWQAYSIYASDSIFLLPFHFILLVVSISAIVIGSIHRDDCPMKKKIPTLIISLGAVGLFAVLLRMIYVVYFYFSHLLRCLFLQRTLVIFANLTFLVMYAVEMWTFFTVTPSFDVKDHNYCHPVFHTYTLILNCGLSAIVFLMFSLHFPAFMFNHFNIGGPGFPIVESQESR